MPWRLRAVLVPSAFPVTGGGMLAYPAPLLEGAASCVAHETPTQLTARLSSVVGTRRATARDVSSDLTTASQRRLVPALFGWETVIPGANAPGEPGNVRRTTFVGAPAVHHLLTYDDSHLACLHGMRELRTAPDEPDQSESSCWSSSSPGRETSSPYSSLHWRAPRFASAFLRGQCPERCALQPARARSAREENRHRTVHRCPPPRGRATPQDRTASARPDPYQEA